MVYERYENFSIKDINNASYFFDVEKESRYSRLQGRIKENAYQISNDGSKHFFKIPKLSNFKLNIVGNFVVPCNESKRLQLVFGYDRKTRIGYAVELGFLPENCTAESSLVWLDGLCRKEIKTLSADALDVKENEDFSISLIVNNNKIEGKFSNFEFTFELPNTVYGDIGIANKNLIAGFEIKSIHIVSLNDIPVKSINAPKKYIIPAVNGNSNPLVLELQNLKFENSNYSELNITLSGGIAEQNDSDLEGDCYFFGDEIITDPFIRIIDKNGIEKINLWNGEGVFYSPNEHRGTVNGFRVIDRIKGYPYIISIPVKSFDENSLISFGYKNMSICVAAYYSGEHEFLFSENQELLWDGKLLDADIQAETVSGEKKKIVSLIPKNIQEYENAVAFASGNHFFFNDEALNFTLKILTKFNSDALKITASLQTFYGDTIKELTPEKKNVKNFYLSDFKEIYFYVSHPSLDVGVYKLCYDLNIGNEKVYSHTSLFEIFDVNSGQSPQLASGLPEIYCGDGAPLRSKVGCFNPWNALRDHNNHHLYNCAIYDPIFSENSKVWELLKLYRRKWFLWFNQRTIGRERDYKDFPNCIKHADYINYIYPGIEESPGNYCRHDLWRYSVYTDKVKEALWEFLNNNPDINDKLKFEDVRKEYTQEMHNHLLETCFEDWIQFMIKRISEWAINQWNPIKELNTSAKRSSYGPYPMYGTKYKTAYSIKFFGQDPHKLDLVDGFWQYEDYPFWCDYKSSDGAFGLATIKLMNPDAAIRPELYNEIMLYCPDGFVALAHPYNDSYYIPPHTFATQIMGYIYNTAYYIDGKFGYWQDNQYMCYGGISDEKFDTFTEVQKQVLKIKPCNPEKSIYYVIDFDSSEDVIDYKINSDNIYNISEANVAYINSLCNEIGVPTGAVTDFESLLELEADNIDILVLPSLSKATEQVKIKIRELYQNGVSLFAVGNVDGLEDIFGIEYSPVNSKVFSISDGIKTENILPINSDFLYLSKGAEVLLWADNNPVLFKKERALKLNICVSRVGVDMWNPSFIGKPNVSEMFKSYCTKLLREVSDSNCVSEIGTGIVLFTSSDSRKCMMITDCTKLAAEPLNWENEKKITVLFKDNVKQLIYAKDGTTIQTSDIGDGKTCALLSLRPMETKLYYIEY